MFKFLAKALAFLFSPKARKAVEVAGQVVDVAEQVVDKAKELQKKGK